jgi:hypothetical protein
MLSYAGQEERFVIRGNIERRVDNRWMTDSSSTQPIASVFPLLGDMIKWRNWSFTSGPMHYVSNAAYHVKNRDWDHFRNHVNFDADIDTMPRVNESIEEWCLRRLPRVLDTMHGDLILEESVLAKMLPRETPETTGDEELAKAIGAYIFESTPIGEGKYRIELRRETLRLVVPEFTCRQKFEAWDVLACLISDAQSGQMSHEDFCANFGGSVDSIQDRKTWIACVRMNRKLKTFLREFYERCIISA